jgi:hypothetical protein
VTQSIFDTLAVLPSGLPGPTLRPDEFGRYLRETVGTDAERDRNRRHMLRDEMYRDGGIAHMKGVIDCVFKDPEVRELRKHWVQHARFNNVLKRLVNELSGVYAEAATRIVQNPTDGVYQSLLSATRIDEVMFQVGRLANLHRSLLVGFRIREKPTGEREPVIDVATPAHVRAVCHPNDPTEVIGWMVRASFASARPGVDVPVWTLWTDHERVHLRENLEPIPGSHVEHGFGMCNWVPVTLGPPNAGFWPGDEGEDMVAAHVSIWMTNVLLLKETKSANKQPVIQGDTSNVARSQSADSEVPIEVGDGTAISSVDNSMDLSLFRDTADHILEHVAQNYGMSASLINHQGVQSAEARDLMRIPLRELRKQQQVSFRRFEGQFVKAMAAVCDVDYVAGRFDPEGWRIGFADDQTPLDVTKETDLFIKHRQAGIDNTVAFIQRQHPGMSYAEAERRMVENIAVETNRNELMRPIMEISGGALGGAPLNLGGANDAPHVDPATEPPSPT